MLPTEPLASPNEAHLPQPWGEGAICTRATGSCLHGGLTVVLAALGGPPHCSPQQVAEAGRGAGCQTQARCSPGSSSYSKGGKKNVLQEL